MTVFNSRVNAGSDAFQQNRQDMLGLIDRLDELNARGAMISEKRRARMEARGQLTPRERLARLLDPGMPFLEVGNLAGYLLDTADEEKSIPVMTVEPGIDFSCSIPPTRRSRSQAQRSLPVSALSAACAR